MTVTCSACTWVSPTSRSRCTSPEAAQRQLARGGGYVPTPGLPTLREALADKLAKVNGVVTEAADVTVTHGGVQACELALAAVVEPGDEVLVADPGWPNHVAMTEMVGGRTVRYPLRPQDGFVPDPDEVAAHVTDRTRALVVNSPANPTGAVLPADVVRGLVDLARRHDLLLLSDEVYDQLVFSGEATSPALFDDEHVVAVYSFSKTYAMTGWRVGYCRTPSWLTPTVQKLMESQIACLSPTTQAGALAALEGAQDQVARMRDTYRGRRDLVVGLLAGHGLSVTPPQGAFYLMVPLAAGADSRAAALHLLDHGVAVSPGSAFGTVAADHLRVSLAASEDVLRRGVQQLLAWYDATDGGRAVPIG